MPSNTPLPAAQLLKLADELLAASSECNAGILCGADEWNRLQLAEEAYRAARAASPRTLEEDILTDIGRGFIKSDEIERQNRYPNDDEQAEMEKVLVRFEEHARRLAGEGGA